MKPIPPKKKNPTQILQVCSGSSTRVPLFIIIITNKTWNHFMILGSSFIIYIIQLIPQLQIHATSLLYSFWTAAQKHWLSNNCSILDVAFIVNASLLKGSRFRNKDLTLPVNKKSELDIPTINWISLRLFSKMKKVLVCSLRLLYLYKMKWQLSVYKYTFFRIAHQIYWQSHSENKV